MKPWTCIRKPPHNPDTDPLQQQRGQIVAALALLLQGLAIAAILITLVVQPGNAGSTVLALGLSLIGLSLVLALTGRGYVQAGAIVLTTQVVVGPIVTMVATRSVTVAPLMLVFSVLIATMVLRPWMIVPVLAADLAGLALAGLLIADERDAPSTTVVLLTIGLVLVVAAMIGYLGARRLQAAIDAASAARLQAEQYAAAIEHQVQAARDAHDLAQKSEHRYRLLVANLPGMVFRMGIHPQRRPVLLFASEGGQRRFGLGTRELGDLIGTPLQPDGDAFARTSDLLRVVSEGGEPLKWERQFARPDGQIGWIEALAYPIMHPDSTLVLEGFAQDITERKLADERLQRRDAILEAVGFAAVQLLDSPDWRTTMPVILARLGEATATSRVYVFERHAAPGGATLVSQRYEWCAPGVEHQIGNPELQGLPLVAAGYSRWEQVLSQGGTVAGHIHAFPPEERPTLEAQGICSLAIVPITLGDRWWGFIGLDHCTQPHTWSAAELSALRGAAVVLGSAIRRQEAEGALRESEARYRSIITALDAGIVVHAPDGSISASNLSAERILGLTHDQLYGRTPSDPGWHTIRADGTPFPSDEHPAAVTLRTSRPCREVVMGVQKPGGELTWISINSQPLVVEGEHGPHGVVALSTDITELKRTADALRESQALLQAILDHSPVPITVQGLPDGRFLLASASMAGAFGLQPDQLIGRTLDNLFPPELVAHWQQHDWEIAITRQSVQIEQHLMTADGRQLEILATRFPLTDASDDVYAIGGLYLDITDRKLNVELAERARAAAEAADSAKSQFLANMSHELRTPLNAVIGMAGLLLDTPLSPAQQEVAATIRAGGDTLLALVNDILDFSKIEADRLELDRQPFSLRGCIEAALDLVALQAAEHKLDLCYTVAPEAPDAVIGDAGRLCQVLVNLLGNGVKFTEHGEVSLAVTAQPAPEGRSRLRILVHDTGIGIAADQIERLFEPFMQADSSTTRRYGGTGLGLSISRRLVTRMGGTIAVERSTSAGTTFRVELCLEVVPGAGDPLAGPLPGLAGRRALVVDDNPTSGAILADWLGRWGARATRVASLHGAIASLNDEPADCVLVDQLLPDGEAAAADLRAHPGAERAALIAIHAGHAPQPATDAQGFDRALTFPLKLTALHAALAEALSASAARQEAARAPALAVREDLLAARVLLVEDNPVNQRVMQQMLRHLGVRADVAGNGREAVEALRRQPYAVVLMDVQMPELDGVAATEAIRAFGAAIPQPWIIALTANAMRGDRERYLASGMDDYLSKPVQLAELAQALNGAGGRGEAG